MVKVSYRIRVRVGMGRIRVRVRVMGWLMIGVMVHIG